MLWCICKSAIDGNEENHGNDNIIQITKNIEINQHYQQNVDTCQHSNQQYPKNESNHTDANIQPTAFQPSNQFLENPMQNTYNHDVMLTPSNLPYQQYQQNDDSYQHLNQQYQQNDSTHIDRDQQPTEFQPSYQEDPMQNNSNPGVMFSPSSLPYPTTIPENSVPPYLENQNGQLQDLPPPYPTNQNGPWVNFE